MTYVMSSAHKVTALQTPSGVGKSSLLNAVDLSLHSKLGG